MAWSELTIFVERLTPFHQMSLDEESSLPSCGQKLSDRNRFLSSVVPLLPGALGSLGDYIHLLIQSTCVCVCVCVCVCMRVCVRACMCVCAPSDGPTVSLTLDTAHPNEGALCMRLCKLVQVLHGSLKGRYSAQLSACSCGLATH